MVGIVSYGAYVPYYRLDRSDIADAWDYPPVPGEIAVANSDEDSITMSVEAGLDCLRDLDGKTIDGLYFASTTAPYKEKQSSSVIAAALDLKEDITTADYTDSLRAGTTAIKGACDAIESGRTDNVLVVASDCRMAPPETMYEYQLGDGAAALLLGNDGVIAELKDSYSITDEFIGPWRKDMDDYVQHFEVKHETKIGYSGNVEKAVRGLMEKSELDPNDFSKVAIYSPDPRQHMKTSMKLGFGGEQIQDSFFLSLGDTGTPLPLMMLISILEEAKDEERILMASYGNGSDAIYLETTPEINNLGERRGMKVNLDLKEVLPNYDHYLRLKKRKIRKDEVPRKSSPVQYWRDRKFLLNLYGAKCNNCGTLQYPIQRVCISCGEKDNFEEVKLSKKGEIFTYTLDHLVAEQYLETPVPRAVIDLDDGCRIFLEVTDCDPKEVEVGIPIELTFRKMHEGGGFKNYYWKCRPRRIE